MMSPFAEIFFVLVVLICIGCDIKAAHDYKTKRFNNKWYREQDDESGSTDSAERVSRR